MIRALSPDGPVALSLIDDPFRPGDRRSRFVPYRRGMTARELADEAWGPDANALAIFPGKGGKLGEVLEPDELDRRLIGANEVVTLARIPAGLEISLGAIIGNILIAAAVSVVMSLLFPPPDAPTPVEEDTSKTYGFNGIRTNYKAVGSTIPIVYGYHGVGGLVISQEVVEALDVSIAGPNKVTQTLRVLIAVCEGPIKSIGGITTDSNDLVGENLPAGLKINGNSAQNLDGVRASVRLGTIEQTAIPGYSIASTIYNVGLAIENWDEDGVAITDWSEAVEYDMPEEGDFATVAIQFPKGLYNVDSNGNTSTLTTEVQIRYQELNSGGSPTGPTVDVLGGEAITFTEAIPSSFTRLVRFPLYDPATVAYASAARSVRLCGAGVLISGTPVATGDTLQANARLPWAGASGSPEAVNLTIEAWYRRANTPPNDEFIWSLADGSFASATVPSQITGIVARVVNDTLRVHWGDGSSFDTLTVSGFNFATSGVIFEGDSGSPWYQVTVTYELAAGPGNEDRLRVFINGAQRAEALTTLRWTHPSTNDRFTLGSWAPQVGNVPSHGWHDRTRIWERVVTPGAVSTAWTALNPETYSSDKLVLDWTMDSNASLGGGAWLVPANGDTTITGDLQINSPIGDAEDNGFLAAALTSGTPKRSRYRVSVQRLSNRQDTSKNQGSTKFQSLTIGIDEQFTYPEVALLGLEIPAQSDASGGTPNFLIPVEGKLVRVRTGGTTTDPVFSTVFSRNPWWIAFNHYIDPRGLGEFHKEGDFDLDNIQQAADYADALVLDGTAELAPQGLLGYDLTDQTWEATFFAQDFPDTWEVGASVEVNGLDSGLIAAGWPPDGSVVEIVSIADGSISQTTPAKDVEFSWPTGLAFPPSGSATPNVTPTATFQTKGPRHRCDIVFDRADGDAWSALQKIVRAGRGAAISLGSSVRFRVQKPEVPVHLFSEANIIEGTLQIAGISPEDEFNTAVAEILNESVEWEREPVQRQADSLKDATEFKRVRRKTFRLEGVTSVAQAARELDVLLESNERLRVTIAFEAFLDAIDLEPGDVFYFANRLPAWDYGGRIKDDSASASDVRLDLDVTLESGKTYRVAVRSPEGLVSEVEVSSGPGTYSAGTAISLTTSLDFEPVEGDLYVLGAETTTTRLFRVTRISLADNFRRKIFAVAYDEDVFALKAMDTSAIGELAALGVQPTDTGAAVAPATITATEASVADQVTGAVQTSVWVSWSLNPADESRVHRQRIFVRRIRGVRQREESTTGWSQVAELSGQAREYRITGSNATPGQRIDVAVQPITKRGASFGLAQLPAFQLSIRGRVQRTDTYSTPSVDRYGPRLRVEGTISNGRQGSLEVRQGGWLLGMPLGASEGGVDVFQLDSYADGSDNADGETALPLIIRERLGSGSYAGRQDYVFATDELKEDDAQADDVAVRQEDFGFNATPPGGTGTPIFTATTISSGKVVIDPASSSLNPSWTSSYFDTGTAARYRVNFSIEAWQVHPATWEDFADEPMDGIWASDWTFEGPLVEEWDSPFSSNMRAIFEIRYTDGANPTSADWVRFRPGTYYGRSFQFRARFRRTDTNFDVEFGKAAFRIYREPFVDPGDLDAGSLPSGQLRTLQVLRSTEANRTGATPAAGEPLWTTDEEKLFIGDGSTAGGIQVGGQRNFMPGHSASRRYFPANVLAAGAGAAGAANFVAFVPFCVGQPTTFTGIGVNVTAAGATTVRLGLYSNSGSQPGSLILDAGTVSITTTGQKTASISQSLTAGWYWLACHFDASPPSLTSTPAGVGHPGIGAATSSVALHSGYIAVQAYASGLPASPTPIPYTLPLPIVWLQR
jgi:hypothetical protein